MKSTAAFSAQLEPNTSVLQAQQMQSLHFVPKLIIILTRLQQQQQQQGILENNTQVITP